MENLTLKSNPAVAQVFENYPEFVRPKMQNLRQLVLDTASALEDIRNLEETLKWGEPSYITKTGSTLRMDWKSKKPDQYALYFTCSTGLVDTFRLLYPGILTFEGKRAIVFQLDDELPAVPLK